MLDQEFIKHGYSRVLEKTKTYVNILPMLSPQDEEVGQERY